jgi:hypothetical protein
VKSTCVTTMKAMSASMSASMSAAPTRECWGRGRKCHCQTGSSYRSIFHNCLLQYG